MKLLVFPSVDSGRLRRIQHAAGPMHVVNAGHIDSALREIADADAFFGKITSELLTAAKRLRWVQSPTASLEHYLFPELIDHACQLSNMRGLFDDVIADHVMACVLCFARNLQHYIRQQIESRWAPIGGEENRPGFETGPGQPSAIDFAHRHLSDCTLGVIGTGRIGSEICRRGAAFDMTLCGVDPVCRSIPGILPEVWPVGQLDRLLAASDFVVIAAPHTPETVKMFRAPQFRAMKSNAYLINIGRGVIVDLGDLTTALRESQIAGAALDVFETEPLPADHPLWLMSNVIITPHIAAASPRIAERHTTTLLENIRRFVAGEEPLTLVDKRRWY